MFKTMAVKLKRAYEPAGKDDGYRVLVERLWPRGIRKQDFIIDAWEKELAPSQELRKWFGHDPKRWPEFVRRYRQELKKDPGHDLLRNLALRVERGTVTLVFSARDIEHNSALVLRDEIVRR